jgi:hypothetical protein
MWKWISPTPWNELESKGYVVVPAFLTPVEIDTFRADYKAAARPGDAARDRAETANDAIDVPYKVRHPTIEARRTIDGKLAAVARSVKHATGIRVNTYSGGRLGSLYFTTDGDKGLDWHQDSVSYYAYQNHYDYLNFYIPIIKPVRAKSNLSVVPFDALAARSPRLAQAVRGRGATEFAVKRGTTAIRDSDRGHRHDPLPYPIDELAVTPELDAGDLLLLRGDVIHRTQDTDTHRVALSLRMMNEHTRIRRSEMVRGGLFKTMLMTLLRSEFQVMFDCFDVVNHDEMTLGKLVSLEASVSRFRRTPTQTEFLKFLLWAKFRALFRGPPRKPERE